MSENKIDIMNSESGPEKGKMRRTYIWNHLKTENSHHESALQWTCKHSNIAGEVQMGQFTESHAKDALLSSCVSILVLVSREHYQGFWWENLFYKEWDLTSSHRQDFSFLPKKSLSTSNSWWKEQGKKQPVCCKDIFKK